MKIIFLDIDGVLNTDRQIRVNALNQIEGMDFDHKAMENLKHILNKTKSNIVITSTWRIHQKDNGYLWRELERNFQRYAIHADVIVGITTVIDETMKPHNRVVEIAEWINANQPIEKFIILDDQWRMGELNDHFIRCLAFNGITKEIADEVIKRLH